MSGREWKPGDVAMHRERGLAVVSDRCDKHFATDLHWHYVDLQGWDRLDDPLSLGCFTGPLVVIDPEDEGTVNRIADAIRNEHGGENGVWCGLDWCATQAALRSLVSPPKPEEPTGLGAVVEDDKGYLWIRSAATGGDPWRAEGAATPKGRTFHTWDDIAAVKVLSEGVIP